jgi:hypothetical protein
VTVRLAIASLVVGSLVTFLFEHTLTFVVGIGLMLAGIVLGLFAIATPEYLGREPD